MISIVSMVLHTMNVWDYFGYSLRNVKDRKKVCSNEMFLELSQFKPIGGIKCFVKDISMIK